MIKNILLCACLSATSVAAQSQAQLDAATAYSNTAVQQKLLDDMFSVEGVMAQMGLVDDRLSAKQKQTIARVLSEEFQTIRPAIVDVMINSMAATFTLEEITALTEFYSSPVGASAMAKMTPFMQQASTQMAPYFQSIQGKLAQRLQAEMSK